MRYLTPAMLLAFLSILITVSIPENSPAAAGRFVDLDGDGLHDLRLDLDSDGIPDDFEPHGPREIHSGPSQVADVFARLAPETVSRARHRVAEQFARRESGASAMSLCRSDFDSGFDSQLGVVNGAATGGACAGGICR